MDNKLKSYITQAVAGLENLVKLLKGVFFFLPRVPANILALAAWDGESDILRRNLKPGLIRQEKKNCLSLKVLGDPKNLWFCFQGT